MNQEEIRIQDLVYILASGWKIMVGALVAGVLLAQVFTALSTEGIQVYAADASMVINSKTYSLFDGDIEVAESNNVYLSQKMVNTYRVILLSDNVLDRVIQDLAIDFTPEGLRTHIEVSSPKDTEVIMVTVTHADPKVATQIANAIMRLAPEVIHDTVEVGTIVVLDEAKIPTAAVKSRQSLLNLLIGGVLGLMVGAFAVFFLWFLKPKIRNKKDILENLNLKCLGEIPHVKLKYRKSPRQMMVTHPGIPFFFLEASKILAQKILYIARENHYKVFAVTSVGPEEGKTTLSVNTALSLASAGNKVLLMDFDFYKKGVSIYFYEDEADPLQKVLRGDLPFEEGIITDYKTGLDVLISSDRGNSLQELLQSEETLEILKTHFADYDYVIIDTPPALLHSDSLLLAPLVDGILFAIRQERATLLEINEVMESFNEVGIPLVGAVLNDIRYMMGTEYRSKYKKYSGYYAKKPHSGLLRITLSSLLFLLSLLALVFFTTRTSEELMTLSDGLMNTILLRVENLGFLDQALQSYDAKATGVKIYSKEVDYWAGALQLYIHALLFFTITLVTLSLLRAYRLKPLIAAGITFVFVMALSIGNEYYQSFAVELRGYEYRDVVFGLTGVVIALIVFALYEILKKPRKT